MARVYSSRTVRLLLACLSSCTTDAWVIETSSNTPKIPIIMAPSSSPAKSSVPSVAKLRKTDASEPKPDRRILETHQAATPHVTTTALHVPANAMVTCGLNPCVPNKTSARITPATPKLTQAALYPAKSAGTKINKIAAAESPSEPSARTPCQPPKPSISSTNNPPSAANCQRRS